MCFETSDRSLSRPQYSVPDAVEVVGAARGRTRIRFRDCSCFHQGYLLDEVNEMSVLGIRSGEWSAVENDETSLVGLETLYNLV